MEKGDMKQQKLLSLSIVAILLLSMTAVFPINVNAVPGTNVRIDPAKVEKYTDTTHANDLFKVYLNCGNFTDLKGYEYKIAWNKTILNVVSVKDFIPYPNYYIGKNLTNNDFNATHGRMYFVVVDTSSPGYTFNGSMTLREITFKIMIEPPAGFGNQLYTLIDLYATVFGDPTATPIPHTQHDSEFFFYYVMPGKPTITVGTFTATFVGQEFDVPVTISGVDAVWKVADVGFNVTYNTTMLDALSVAEGGFFSGFGTTTFTSSIDEAAGEVHVYVELTALTTPGVYPSGSGTLARIHFNATYGEVGIELKSDLILHDVNVSDFFHIDIGYKDLVNGWAKVAIPSPAVKALGVVPPVTTVIDEGIIFTIDIWVYNISSVDKLFGVQFKLCYDPTLIQFISAEAGPFLHLFPWNPPPGDVFFFTSPKPNYVTIATGLLDGGLPPPGYIFPFGEGSVAKLKFMSIYGLPGSTLSCVLDIPSVIFGDYFANPIPVGLVHDGMYYITLDKRYIDVYTQYQYPYGGQKRYHDADAYAPQDLVILHALVTYNRWPVQNKLVEFEIHGPPNPIYNITLYRTAFTDENGIATIDFRVDWPCDDPETIVFGIWTVYAAVDLDQIKVVDVLHFEAGWLIKINKITFNEAQYRHGWHITVTLQYTSISAQLRPALFTITIYDDAGYGLGTMTIVLPAVKKGTYTVELTCFRIPKWARAGTATAYANAFTDWPTACGVPYCPEVADTFIILPL
jgi:hypothetical protein